MNEHENMIPCACCGELHDPDDLTTTRDGDLVCEDCLSDEYGYCEHCMEYVPFDELDYVNEGTPESECWCSSCRDSYAAQCNDCGRWFTSRWGRSDEYGHDICDTCYENHDYITCEDCGAILRYDCAEEIGGCWYCSSCAASHRPDSIHRYGYKPEPEIAYRGREDQSTTLTFGVELEVDEGEEDNETTARRVTDAADGRLYCKHDGSLGCNGFEIVSHPASLAYHLYEFRWANIMRLCDRAGYKSHDTSTCGLHLHVGRAQLGEDQHSRSIAAGNLVLLAWRLSGELLTFSRRTVDKLENWAALPRLGSRIRDDAGQLLPDDILTDEALYTENAGRYQAVNLTNTHTVEFRLFRGTLKRDTLAASLELVNNLCLYAMTHTPTQCATANFADVVGMDPKSELVDYCLKHQLISHEITAANPA